MKGLRMGRVFRILAKEIREARRDRNLIVYVVLVPLFLYPLLMFLLFQVLLVVRGMSEREVTQVAVGPDVPAALVEALREREGLEVVEAPAELAGGGEADSTAFRRVRQEAARRHRPELQALLVWRSGAGGEPDSALVLFDGSRERSTNARDDVKDALEEWRRGLELAAFEQVGLAERDLDVWRIEEEDTASAEQRGREILSLALPMILLIMLAQGTFYSTLDTVVGERERGTLETLLTSPITRGEALLGKFLFVVLSSVVALLLNLASLTIFFGFLLRLMRSFAGAEEIRVTIAPEALLLIVITALLTAGLLAAVLMVLAAPAKTYREGQAALTPAFLVLMIPALVVSVSREPFGMSQAVIPVLNSTALFEAALNGEVPAGPTVVTLAVLAVCAGVALAFASRLVGREDIYVDPTLTLRRVLTGREGSRR